MIIILALPSVFSDLITFPENTIRFLLISIFSLIWILSNFKANINFPAKHVILLLSGYYTLNILSSFWSLNPADSIMESQRIGTGIILILIFNSILKTEEKYISFLKSYLLFISFLIVSVSSDFLQLEHYSFEALYDVQSFFIHKNILASFLFLSLSLTSFSILKLKTKWKLFSILISSLLLLTLLLLFNRTTYLAIAVTAFTFIILKLKPRAKSITIVLTIFISFISFYSYHSISKMNQSNTITSTNSISERLNVWENTIELIKEKPILGVGAGNWQYNFLKHSVSDINKIVHNNTTFQKPHNDFLWVLSELGIIGILLFLLIVFFIFKPALKPILKKHNIELSLIISFLIGLAVISFFSFPKERLTHISLTVILISILLLRTKSTLQLKHDFIYKYLILILLCFNLTISFFVIKGQYYTKLLLYEKQNNNPTAVINYGEQALSIYYTTDETSTPISSYIGWASLLVNDVSKLNYHTQNAYSISPYDFEVLSNYAVVLLKNKQLTEAKEMLLQAYNINAHSEQVLINLFILEYNVGNYEKAYTYLERIKNYERDYPMETKKIRNKLLTN